MTNLLDSTHLRDCGWNLPPLFSLTLSCKGGPEVLMCHEVVRILPRKRLVCLGTWKDFPVVLKIYLDQKRGKKHCKREFSGIQALKQANIKTPTFLFMGTLFPDESPALVFERILDAKTLREVWEETTEEVKRKEIMRKSLCVIAQHHEAGIMQEDLHLGNFLCQEALHETPYTIDGAAVNAKGLGKPLAAKKSLDNLALFLAQFDPAYDRNLPEILLDYISFRKGWEIDNRVTNRVLKRIKRWRKIRRNNYLKKIFRECSAFVCKKRWNRFMVCDRDYYKGEMKEFLAEPDRWIHRSKRLKNGNTSTVSIFEIEGKRFVVKRYNIKGAFHALKRLFRRSRAWISWKNAHRLRIFNITTPKPVALIEERFGPLRMRAYFVCEYVEGSNLLQFFRYEKKVLRDKTNLIVKTANLLKQFADFSISHGDLKCTNFIVSGEGIYITDLDSMIAHRLRWTFRKAFKRDCKRFMKNWSDLPDIMEGFRTQLSDMTF